MSAARPFAAADLSAQRGQLRSSRAPRVTTLGDVLSQQRFVEATKTEWIKILEEEHARCL